MTPMLAPLVGDAPTVTFIGLCKNAGKTTAMCRLMEELPGETLALTSVGRDGERTDVVTGTEKPEIWVRAGTLFATARGMLPLCDATLRVEAVTDVMTPLGAVGILRALSDGYIQLAGPSAVSQLGPLSRTFRALGAQRVLIDGAAGRRSLAGVEPGAAAILCVGASVDGGVPAIAAETAHICALFDAPEGDGPALRSALREEEGRYALIPALEGMEIQSMEESLNLLDPSGRRLPAFSVENAFAPALERVRAEKALVEGRLRQAEGTERDGLMACRRSLVERENQLELEARKGLTMSLLRQRESLLAAMEAVGRLDLLLAKARLARRFSCCRPEITKQPRVEAVDMVHPEAAAYLGERGGSFTAVSLTLERGTTVITGANMGGKSVSMKSLTLNLLLAQTGFFTFAGAFSAPLFHSVCLICTDRQSVEQGLSSFGAEMSALGAGATGMTPAERLQPTELYPEMATLDCGTCNFGDDIFVNDMPTMRAFGRRMLENHIKPEYECFEIGHLDTVLGMAEKGLVPGAPMHFNFVLGVSGCTPATVGNLDHLVRQIPAGSTWTVTGVGRGAWPMAAAGIIMGGHVRVGFEDNIYLEKGRKAASNGELVAKVVRLARELGREVAAPDEARRLLSLA